MNSNLAETLVMQVRAVIYHPDDVSEQVGGPENCDRGVFTYPSKKLYQETLTRVDADTRAKVKRFYRREDACSKPLLLLSTAILTYTYDREKGL